MKYLNPGESCASRGIWSKLWCVSLLGTLGSSPWPCSMQANVRMSKDRSEMYVCLFCPLLAPQKPRSSNPMHDSRSNNDRLKQQKNTTPATTTKAFSPSFPLQIMNSQYPSLLFSSQFSQKPSFAYENEYILASVI